MTDNNNIIYRKIIPVIAALLFFCAAVIPIAGYSQLTDEESCCGSSKKIYTSVVELHHLPDQTPPCCGSGCNCSFGGKPIPGNFFVSIIKNNYIPDFSLCGTDYFSPFNLYAENFKNAVLIKNLAHSGKIPIYILKSSMLC